VDEGAHRQQQLYWNQMIELRVAIAYIRRYRDERGRWVTGLGTVRAIASSGRIAAWAIWKEHAFVWGAIIAASQVADALKEVFPFSKTHKSASEHTITLGGIFIDAQLEWENTFSGRYTNEQITNRRHKLMKLQHDAERHNFPHGLATKAALFAQAQEEAKEYFASTYGVDGRTGGSFDGKTYDARHGQKPNYASGDGENFDAARRGDPGASEFTARHLARWSTSHPASWAGICSGSAGVVGFLVDLLPVPTRSRSVSTTAKLAPVHAGEVLKATLTDFRISMNRLAQALRVPGNRISGIVAGQSASTGETALRSARYFGTTPEYWIGMQVQYDLETARDEWEARIESEVSPLQDA